jgi:hypothetical protein
MRLPPVFAACALLGGPVLAKVHVAVPEVAWDELVPYVRANIVPQGSGNEVHVYVCEVHTDRSVVTPFDEELGDFTRVLITETMREDSKAEEAIARATESLRAVWPTLDDGERARASEHLWRELAAGGDLLPRLRSSFEAARARGHIRCRLCEKDATFASHARRAAAP